MFRIAASSHVLHQNRKNDKKRIRRRSKDRREVYTTTLSHNTLAATNVNAANMPALPLFTPAPPTTPLKHYTNVHPRDMCMQWTPNWKSFRNTLLRSVDADHRDRYVQDDRTKLFTELQLGSVVVVEQVSSRTQPRKQLYSGIVVSKRERGITSSITVRSYVLKTGIEVMFNIYSPMVIKVGFSDKIYKFKIHVLKGVKSGSSNGDRKTLRFLADPSVIDLPETMKAGHDLSGNASSIRDKVDYSKVDELTVRYKEKERRNM